MLGIILGREVDIEVEVKGKSEDENGIGMDQVRWIS